MTKGCLLIHGFTGGPFEVLPLAEFLTARGYRVEVPTLSGHAFPERRLKDVTYRDWLEDAAAAYHKLSSRCDRVSIVGFSMGGLLAVNLALRVPVSGLALLSTPVYVWDVSNMIKEIWQGLRTRNFNQIRVYLWRIRSTPWSALFQFRTLLKRTKPLFKKVRVPSLILQGAKDAVVKAKSAGFVYERLGSKVKNLQYLPASPHVICCGPEKEAVFSMVYEFLLKVERGQAETG